MGSIVQDHNVESFDVYIYHLATTLQTVLRTSLDKPELTVDLKWDPERYHGLDVCRKLGTTYTCAAQLTIRVNGPEEDHPVECFMELPLMVGSRREAEHMQARGLPALDRGASRGYFYIGGNEYVFISQMDAMTERIVVNTMNRSTYATFKTSAVSLQHADSASVTVRARPPKATRLGREGIVVRLNKVEYNVFDLIVALGEDVHDDEDVHESIVAEICQALDSETFKVVYATLQEIIPPAAVPQDRATALRGLRCDTAETCLRMFAIPGDRRVVRSMLLALVGRIAMKMGGVALPIEEDRDSCANMHVLTAGHMLTIVTKRSLAYMLSPNPNKKVKKNIRQNGPQILRDVCGRLRECIVKGEIRSLHELTGATSILDRTNQVATMSMCRRLAYIVPAKNKSLANITTPRYIRSFSFRRICPNETPNGQNMGLTSNLTVHARVSGGHDCDETAGRIIELIEEVGGAESSAASAVVNVFVNGFFVKTVFEDRVDSLVDNVHSYRTSPPEPLHCAISIAYKRSILNELHFRTDAGRILRPMRVESRRGGNGGGGVVVLVDAMEEAYAVDAGLFAYSEVPFASTTGIVASMVPFIAHTQAPRVQYFASGMKQAMSAKIVRDKSNDGGAFVRPDHELLHAQHPLIVTKAMRDLRMHEPHRESGAIYGPAEANGLNARIAVMSYEGFNQEDALIVKRGFLQRGGFLSIVNSRITVDGLKMKLAAEIASGEKVCIDEETDLAVSRIPTAGEPIHPARARFPRALVDQHRLLDAEQPLGRPGRLVASLDYATHTGPGVPVTDKKHVGTSRLYSPYVGDKFICVHGQKMTIGRIVNDEDMPVSEETGLSPDILINPHSLPSRMTVGLLIELFRGNQAARRGEQIVVAPFSDEARADMAELMAELKSNDDKEAMSNGCTGASYAAPIFVGTGYVCPNKHMASEKAHARTKRGALNRLTLQPIRGRARDGGYRIGHMEICCCIAHDAYDLLHNMLNTGRDMVEIDVRASDGVLGLVDEPRPDGDAPPRRSIRVSRAFEVLVEELRSLHMGFRVL
jgi:DNA-directed RNA polymerase subunit B